MLSVWITGGLWNVVLYFNNNLTPLCFEKKSIVLILIYMYYTILYKYLILCVLHVVLYCKVLVSYVIIIIDKK